MWNLSLFFVHLCFHQLNGLVRVIKKLVTDNSEFMNNIMSSKLKSKLCRSNYFDLKTFSFIFSKYFKNSGGIFYQYFVLMCYEVVVGRFRRITD